MSHITRRKFIAGSAAVVGVSAFAPVVQMFPAPLPLPAVDPYAAFAEELVKPILAEIKEASIMRQLFAIKKLEEKYVRG
jgi:hypothetical protein